MRLELWSMRPCRAVVPWLSAIALARVVILSLTFVLSSFTHVETLMRLRPFLGVPTPAGHGYRVSPARLAREWRRGDQKKISPERLGQYASASHASVTRGPRPLIPPLPTAQDRKSTRLNSSHPSISYAVFCLKKKKQHRSRR